MMNKIIKLFFQASFFQKNLTFFLGKLAAARQRWVKNLFITVFCRCYVINMTEAVEENPFVYATFNDFFIRRLKATARPIDPVENVIVSPADGTLSEIGFLAHDCLLQAKGKQYSALQLLAGQTSLAKIFEDGAHALIYLAPHNYHRVHMPITGRLLQMIYVPGTLFSVSPFTAQHVDGLFAKNERVIAIFETSIGKMALILVGAMIVGSITTVWAGKITPPRNRDQIAQFHYDSHPITFEKGEELAYFSLGSTVILLFEKDKVSWCEELSATAIKMGQGIAQYCLQK